MVNITISGSAVEVLKEMEQLCNLQSVTIKPLEIEKPAKEKSAPKAVAAPLLQPTMPIAGTTSTPQTVPTTSGAIGLADIQAIVPKLAAKIQRQGVLDLFKKYGATKGSEIKPEDFEKFHAEAKTLLA